MSNVPIVYRVLTEEGRLSPHAAAGFIGRLQQESGQGLNPEAHGDKSIEGGGSRGIAQWNRERKNNLHAFAGDAWADPAMQARFALHEMGIGGDPNKPGYGSEAASGKALMSAQNISDATIAAMGYERPQHWTAQNPTAGHGYHNTVANAQKLYEQVGDPNFKAQAPAGAPGAASPESAAAAQRYGADRPMGPVAAAGGGPVDPVPPVAMNDPNYGGAGTQVAGDPLQPPGAFPPAPDAPMTMRDRLAKAIGSGGGAIGKMGGGQAPVVPGGGGMGAVMSQEGAMPPIDPAQAAGKKNAMLEALKRLNTGSLVV